MRAHPFDLAALATALLAAYVSAFSPGTARADDVDVSAVRERARREIGCFDRIRDKLGRSIRLLRESEAQTRAAGASEPVRRDAARAIRALEVRLEGLLAEARDCLEVREDARGRAEVEVDPPADPSLDAVAEPNPATHVVERDAALDGHVRVQVGQLVDGLGRVDDPAVRAAVRGIGPNLAACYRRLVDHGALERGTAILVFTVTPSGRVRDVQVEQPKLGGPHFLRCLEHAGRRLEVRRPARGGAATYSYTLRFGP